MIEDASFNAFLKARLEENVEVPAVSGVAGSRVDVWLRPVLLAASVALVCGLFSWQLLNGRAARQERRAAQAIEFLEVCDLDEFDVRNQVCDTAGSFAEKLLAWQDAPYAALAD